LKEIEYNFPEQITWTNAGDTDNWYLPNDTVFDSGSITLTQIPNWIPDASERKKYYPAWHLLKGLRIARGLE